MTIIMRNMVWIAQQYVSRDSLHESPGDVIEQT